MSSSESNNDDLLPSPDQDLWAVYPMSDDVITNILDQIEGSHNTTTSPTISSISSLSDPSSPKRSRDSDSYTSALEELPSKYPRLTKPLQHYYPIVHHLPIHELLADLAYGVQYTLVHLITTSQLSLDEPTPDFLSTLQGPNAEAIKTQVGPSTLQQQMFVQKEEVNTPWAELDKEEAVLQKDLYGGLGSNPDFPEWYGGRIAFKGKCALGSSCCFTRRFGSKSFIRLKVPPDIFYSTGQSLSSFLTQPFTLWSHVFRACYAKEDNVFLFKVNETLDAVGELKLIQGLNLDSFVNWFNPLYENRKQPMSKWSSCFALGFSNSIPGPQLSPDLIMKEDDVVSIEGSDMTDGCGFCSFRLLSHIQEYTLSDSIQ
ncbi:hypothetical protein AMATHDRAFT_9895 [Amanita thiersii Skay4041]|uniref:RNA-dependent RNA polymerase n=1 Tax=Amanita thiersii Skay4041 TaxID=703135 RepID=A0A2A9NBN6_9AGAR|nr:hypothetical protein AMATHDRAFT_9895 [Amanita thiersii Skay4041]